MDLPQLGIINTGDLEDIVCREELDTVGQLLHDRFGDDLVTLYHVFTAFPPLFVSVFYWRVFSISLKLEKCKHKISNFRENDFLHKRRIDGMYDSNKIAERIKVMAQIRGISVRQVLANAGLGYNTMSNMKTSTPKADNLGKIADELDCSVDYLLGRTDKPEVNR